MTKAFVFAGNDTVGNMVADRLCGAGWQRVGDAGAADAVMKNDRSLLPAGIVAVEGDFRRGDVVCVYRTETHEYLGRGIVKYSRDELAEMIGSDSAAGESEAINRDDWVGAKD